jgi:hypothetical protein
MLYRAISRIMQLAVPVMLYRAIAVPYRRAAISRIVPLTVLVMPYRAIDVLYRRAAVSRIM